MIIRALLIAALFVTPVWAAGTNVPLPRERPAATKDAPVVPMPRPRPAAGAVAAEPAPAPSSSSEPPASSSVEPGAMQPPEPVDTPPAEPTAPPRDYQVACPALMQGAVTGKSLPPIHEGQCGIQSPLSIEAISANGRSIPLNAPVITDCGMATAVPEWIGEVDSYLAAHDKTSIAKINLSTNYECRNVDHAKTGNLSFHSFADALDLMGFTLKDGRTISIAPGFNGTPEQGRDILHFARDSACTHFMTVLSPDADGFHQDNMHLDLACHGKMCTARLCE